MKIGYAVWTSISFHSKFIAPDALKTLHFKFNLAEFSDYNPRLVKSNLKVVNCQNSLGVPNVTENLVLCFFILSRTGSPKVKVSVRAVIVGDQAASPVPETPQS